MDEQNRILRQKSIVKNSIAEVDQMNRKFRKTYREWRYENRDARRKSKVTASEIFKKGTGPRFNNLILRSQIFFPYFIPLRFRKEGVFFLAARERLTSHVFLMSFSSLPTFLDLNGSLLNTMKD